MHFSILRPTLCLTLQGYVMPQLHQMLFSEFTAREQELIAAALDARQRAQR